MSKRKLLLADDSITIQKVINLTFQDEGIEVTAVGDGDSAVEKIGEIRPDIVLADVNMPGLTGYQICEILREDEETSEIPVILLVGSFEPFDQDEARRVGANTYFTKPFQSIKDLVATVGALMNTRPEKDNGEGVSAEQPETDDIEALYRESFAETVEMAHDGMMGEVAYAGMDDEMIQTSHVGDEQSETQREFHEIEVGTTDDTVEFRSDDSALPDEVSTAQIARSPFDAPAGDSADHDENYVENAAVLDAQEESLKDLYAAETVSFEKFEPDNSRQYVFDEIDLLEIPGGNEGAQIHFTTPADAAGAGSSTQVVSLSPELLDIIVQKVVEKLAEKY